MENPFDENEKKRPTMLNVICILTFIGSGWSVLSGLTSLFSGNNSEQSMQAFYSMANANPAMADMVNSAMEFMQAIVNHATQINLTSLVLSVASLMGAILMYRLKRIGFYLYAAAQVIALFVYPYFVGFSFITIVMFAFSAVFAALFIILYAVNLKHLK